MYKCMDNNGNTLATYANLSEAKTYWEHSSIDCEFQDVVREGEVTVFDRDGKEIGSIKLPKDK